MSVVVKGKVTVKVHGILKQKQLAGNWAVLYDGGGSNDQPPSITLYDSNDQATPLHTIILEHLKFPDKSYQHQEPFLVVSIKKDKHQFQFEDAETKEEWLHSFCHVSTDLWKQWASGKESSETESDSLGDMSDNLLYDSFSAAPTFKVSVNPTPASERNNVRGHYLLSPTKDSLKLLEMDSSKCIFEWSYKQIRKYGKTSTLFKMEVGRSCPTGPGEFAFFTPDGQALSEVIAMQTRLTFNQSYKPSLEKAASSAPAENTDSAESQTSDPVTSDTSPQQPPPAAAAAPQRKEVRHSASKESRRSQADPPASVDPKRETPKPAPRTSITKAKKERGSVNGLSEAPPTSSSSSSSDTKIYATPSGLTAPLDSPLRQELQNKVQNQLSHTSQASQIEDDPPSDNARNSMSSHGSIESLKDKRKSDRERKKLEKEQKAAEAKRKKQLEKEQKEKEKELKEQRERETKEEKERQKKLKKESKSREKLKSKKSVEVPVPEPEPCGDGNIYDEPGELLRDQQAAAAGDPVEADYCEAGGVIPALQQQQPSKSASAEGISDVYATPFKPKDSWKTHARPESDQVHNEDYDAIRQACQSQPSSQRPAHPSHALAEDEDDTYNHLGAFKPLTPAPENIYGMASATDTVEPYRPAAATPSVVENEYEEASAVCTSLSSKPQAAQGREDPRRSSLGIRVALEDGDYAAVSET